MEMIKCVAGVVTKMINTNVTFKTLITPLCSSCLISQAKCISACSRKNLRSSEIVHARKFMFVFISEMLLFIECSLPLYASYDFDSNTGATILHKFSGIIARRRLLACHCTSRIFCSDLNFSNTNK